MKKFLIISIVVMLTSPVMARSDIPKSTSGGKGSASQNNNPNTDRNCYYCWKDLSTQYTPSRHKYGKTQ